MKISEKLKDAQTMVAPILSAPALILIVRLKVSTRGMGVNNARRLFVTLAAEKRNTIHKNMEIFTWFTSNEC